YRLSDTDPAPFGNCAAHAAGETAQAGGTALTRAIGKATTKAWPHAATGSVSHELSIGQDFGSAAVVASKKAEIGIVADYQYFNGISGRAGHGANSASDIAALLNAV